MMASLKAELRKLLTVRSTYVVLLFALALEIFFAFYATSYRATLSDAKNVHLLAGEALDATRALISFGAIVGVLLMTHEYRYNTIVYTLSASRSRSRVLLAKVIVISGFAILFTAIVAMLSPALALLGWHVRGVSIVPQQFDVVSILWRTIFTGWGYSMLAMIMATIIRIQVGAIAALFLVPATVEQLLGLLLKNNTPYLPFNALSTVLEPNARFTSLHVAIIAAVWIVGGWLITWFLFLKRDAN